jgi:hypothetical protein
LTVGFMIEQLRERGMAAMAKNCHIYVQIHTIWQRPLKITKYSVTHWPISFCVIP